MKLPKNKGVVVVGSDPDSNRNYMRKVMALFNSLPDGQRGNLDVEVRHDSDCPILHGLGYCACDPDVSLVEPKDKEAARTIGDFSTKGVQVDHQAKAGGERPRTVDEIVELADQLSEAMKVSEVPGLTVVVDRSKNAARCEFTCSDEQLVSIMTSVWGAAIMQLPDDRKLEFMTAVAERVNFSLFDPRGEQYRPYGSDMEGGKGNAS